MSVEAAVRQADVFHDVGDARAVVPAAPNGARGGPDDPFVGDLLAAWGGPPGGGSAHMMIIIYQSGAERKRPTPGLIGGRKSRPPLVALLEPVNAAIAAADRRGAALVDAHRQPGTCAACAIHLRISGPCAASRVFTLTERVGPVVQIASGWWHG